jgi:Mediator complex subunit MED14
MDDADAKQKLSLPFGDVIKRVAFAIYNQLQNVLHNMRIQSPELRTQTLILFISRSKKKLAQLLAITRWLEMPGVSQFFSNMSQLHFKITMRENRLNENQDALYFTHSQLFSRRIRSLDVVTAKDILARGTYPHLPTSIFSNGTTAGKSLEKTQPTEITLRKSLDLYLRSKLALDDEVPSDINSSTIDNGVLTIRVNNMYELMLTIDYLDIRSPWNILRLKLCVSSHSNESFHSRQNLSEVENDVLMVMRRISAKSYIPVSTPTPNVDGSSNEESPHSENPLADATSMTMPDAINGYITVDTCSGVRTPLPLPLLPRFHLICQHTALATALRYLYLQALEASRTIWVGICQAEFQEKRDYSQLVVRFWKSHTTSHYQYELRVIQIRSSRQIYVPIDIETALVDEDGKEIGGDVGLTADVRDFSRESALIARPESAQSDGSSSSSSPLRRKTKKLKLLVELWTCSAPDDSEGSLKMTRRRVKESYHESTRQSTCEDTAKNSTAATELEIGLTPGSVHVQDGDSLGLFDATEFVIGGVTFGGMFQKVLGYCASNRLDVLHRRFLKTPGVLAAQSSIQVMYTVRFVVTETCTPIEACQTPPSELTSALYLHRAV